MIKKIFIAAIIAAVTVLCVSFGVCVWAVEGAALSFRIGMLSLLFVLWLMVMGLIGVSMS